MTEHKTRSQQVVPQIIQQAARAVESSEGSPLDAALS
jgi:hypothetical protein